MPRPARQRALALSDDPVATREAEDERRLAEAFRFWFALKAQEADLTGPAPPDIIQAVERAGRAIQELSRRLLPTEADLLYAQVAEAWHVQSGRNPETGRIGYWPGPGATRDG
jgi:hypothetical protein